MSDWKPGDPVEQPARGSRLFPPEVATERTKELARRGQIQNRRALKEFMDQHWERYNAIRAEVDAERGPLPGESGSGETLLPRYRRPERANQ